MRTKRYKFNQKTFITIVDDYDCPISPYVSNYINAELSVKSLNTTKRYVEELLFLLRFCESESIDLVERVLSGSFMHTYEYKKFYEASYIQQNTSISKIKSYSFSSTEDKHFRNIISASIQKSALVCADTIRGRLRSLRSFIEWLYTELHADNNIPAWLEANYEMTIKKISNDEMALRKNRNKYTSDPEQSVIPDEIFEELKRIIKPSCNDNPFKGARFRNYLIVNIIIETGIRRGTLAKIKISDCKFHGSFDSVSVYRTPDDETDPRANRPSHKTKPHIATVSPELMEAIKLYIDSKRNSFPRAHSHDFVFVSEKDSKRSAGLPISLNAINSIFQKLSQALNFHIHPHLLRHKWNEIFDKKGESVNISGEELENIRKYAMGWDENTSMNQLYNEKRLVEKNRKISMAHQDKINKKYE